jgi:hypothetical protein
LSTPPQAVLDCASAERLMVLYVCAEASPDERRRLEQHVGACSSCAAQLSSELRLHQALVSLRPPADILDATGALLAQCRSELAEALDDAEQGSASLLSASRHGLRLPRFFGRLRDTWRLELAMHPALAATAFVLVGLVMGRLLPASTIGGAEQSGIVPAPQVTVTAAPRLSDQELQNLGVSGIEVTSDNLSGSPNVELHLRAVKPLDLEGNAGDADIQRVLGYVISNGSRFDPDVRLDSIEVLRSHADQSDVRRVLCQAARQDSNPAVRLSALEALHNEDQDAAVREAFLDVLAHDANPGVRIEAINELRSVVEAGHASEDTRVRELLHHLSQRDPNNYVRLQAAAAFRKLEAAAPQP